MARDVVVIGAGPAGMTAAATAAEHGADVLVLDDQTAAGGQIYRGIESSDAALADILGADYLKGRDIARRFRASGAAYHPQCAVWQVTDDRQIAYTGADGARLIEARHIILATGAMERPFPIPGWTLPGVMMTGAAQTLLKSSAMVADDVVFAGCGPLLYLVAVQYLRAGARVTALLDTTAPRPHRRAAPHIASALARADLLVKGQRWMREVKARGVKVVTGVSDLRVDGTEAAQAVRYRVADEAWQRMATSHVCLHLGVVPNVNLAMSVGVAHKWCDRQLCWHPETDDWGRTSIDATFVAGDGAGISGATSAAASGELAALQVLFELGRLSETDRDRAAGKPLSVRRREYRIRPFLDAWFRPADRFRVPSDPDTIVCRCEEVRLGEISRILANGIAGPNQLKSFSRAGMGPCQGRFCGLTVQELIANARGVAPGDVGYYRLRPPIKPVPLRDIADLQVGDPDEGAVG